MPTLRFQGGAQPSRVNYPNGEAYTRTHIFMSRVKDKGNTVSRSLHHPVYVWERHSKGVFVMTPTAVS